MSVTYTAGWYALWRGIVVYLYFDHPYLLRDTLFLLLFFLLPLPFLVWMGAPIGITAGVTGSWAGGWGIMLLLSSAQGVANRATKPYTVSISEEGVRNEAWHSKAVMKWSDVIKIMCVEDGVIIFQNGCGGGFLCLPVHFRIQFKRSNSVSRRSITGSTRQGDFVEPGDGREG